MTEPTPAQSETTREPITAEWEGLTVTLPPLDDVDLDVLANLETGRTAAAVRGILADTWAELQAAFVEAKGRKIKVVDLAPLMDVIAVAYGFKAAGE